MIFEGKMKKFSFDYDKISAQHGKDVADAVDYLYEIYHDGMYYWLAGLFDKENGGIYYSNSARDNDGYLADIESTNQGLGLARGLGVMRELNDLPPLISERTLAFAKSLEDPDDGYFYHPQWGKDISVGRKGRDLDSSIGVIRWLGGKPDYPTALDRITSNDKKDDGAIPPHLRSREAFLEYLENYDICTNSYPKGHNISSQRTQIAAAGLGDVCIDFINSLQRPDTALWEDKVDYESANGLLKISTLYPAFSREYPNALNAVKTEIAVTLSDEPVGGITDIYNPWIAFGILLENIKTFGGEESYAEARQLIVDNTVAMIRKSKDKLAEFYKPDGSFSYFKKTSSPTSQGAPAAVPGSVEGDVNATALSNATRAKILEILGIDTGKPFGEEDRAIFQSLITP